MTPAQFTANLRRIKPGESFVYHVGLLMYERCQSVNYNGWRAIDELGKAAWEAHEQRKASLTQRRIEDGVCAYIATRL